jgi:hypothetical protein
MNGAELIIHGERFAFAISRKNADHVENSFQTVFAHIPYNLKLCGLDGEELANGCVISKDAPLLDQISSLFACIKSGNEQTVIDTANWFNRQPAFAKYFPSDFSVHAQRRLVAASNERCASTSILTSSACHYSLTGEALWQTLANARDFQPVIEERLRHEMAEVDVSYIFSMDSVPRPVHGERRRAQGPSGHPALG